MNTKGKDWHDFFNLTHERGWELFKAAKKLLTDEMEKSFDNVWAQFKDKPDLVREDIKTSTGVHTVAPEIIKLAQNQDELNYLLFIIGQFDQTSEEILQKIYMKKIVGTMFDDL